MRLLGEVRALGVDTLGVTNTEDSPLAREATAVLATRAGVEATVSCKTYLAAQAALAFAGEAARRRRPGGGEGRPGGRRSGGGGYLADWRSHVASLVPLLRGVRAVYYAGRGPSLAAAATAGLITKESTHRPAEGMTAPRSATGRWSWSTRDVFLLVFAGAWPHAPAQRGAGRRRAGGGRAGLSRRPGRSRAGLPPAGIAEIARPVVELLPVEMITLALAAIDGREAGRFERATKVTTTE